MDQYNITLTFTEPLLGTVALDPEVYGTYIAGQIAENGGEVGDEMESLAEALTLAEALEKGSTGFHRVDGVPILYDYVIKGFLKDACGMLRRTGDSGSAKLTAYKKAIDGLVFVKPRRIPIVLSGETGWLERPLRAQTAQGERVALARSETVPAGSAISFRVLVLGQIKQSLLEEWLTYGELRGLGQWRNGGYGSFTYQLEKA